jgi:hypothetical protein
VEKRRWDEILEPSLASLKAAAGSLPRSQPRQQHWQERSLEWLPLLQVFVLRVASEQRKRKGIGDLTSPPMVWKARARRLRRRRHTISITNSSLLRSGCFQINNYLLPLLKKITSSFDISLAKTSRLRPSKKISSAGCTTDGP